MQTIPLTQGKVALVDDEDYLTLSKFKWCAAKNRNNWYAVRGLWCDGKTKVVFMHRIILSMEADQLCDHVDGNGLNNTRSNLRLANRNENCRNRVKYTKGVSKFKGVFLDKKALTNRWRTRITVNNKKIHIGCFETEEAAAIAYNNAAIKYHGAFAKLNNINLEGSGEIE